MVSLCGWLGRLIQSELKLLRGGLGMVSSQIPLFQILCKPIKRIITALAMIRDICVQLMIIREVQN